MGLPNDHHAAAVGLPRVVVDGRGCGLPQGPEASAAADESRSAAQVGTGLFLGAGGRLAHARTGLFRVYAFCGVFVFLILRALGELVLHRPSSGSFVSYAREFFGEKAAYVAGWMYFLNWAMTSIVDSTAIATYFHFWSAFKTIPQWLIALIALALVLGVNLISVKVFGELEFWAALIKSLRW